MRQSKDKLNFKFMRKKNITILNRNFGQKLGNWSITLAMLAVLATPFGYMGPASSAQAATTVFSDEQYGHNHEVLQQEVQFEHNPESELRENNSLTNQPLPADIPPALPDQNTNPSPVIPAEIDEPTCQVDNDQNTTAAASSSAIKPGEAVDELDEPEQPDDCQPEISFNKLDNSPSQNSLSPNSPQQQDPNPETCQPNPDLCDGAEFIPFANESQTTDNSDLDTEQQTQVDIDIVNTNDIQVDNQIETAAITGENQVLSEDDIENTKIETGDVNVFANVLNIANTNMYGSEIVEVVENFNNLSSDLYLNNLETSPAERSQGLISGLCDGSIECQSLASFRLTNQNQAQVNNDVSVYGDSGLNTIDGWEVEDSQIKTGDVNAIVNVLNIVNTNLVNSRWTIASFNVFGDWAGDLVLPSELYFRDAMAVGTAIDSDLLVEEVQKVILDVKNINEAEIENNVLADADTGNNAILATGTPDGKGGDIEQSSIDSGQAETHSNVVTHTNQTYYNGMWFLGLVNTLGDWSGDIYALPDEVAMATTNYGMSFFATSAQDPEALAAFEQAMIEANTENEVNVGIENTNDAKIVNNVVVGAYSGNNTIQATEVERSHITTGNAKALANILNFANTNLINADLYIGLTNIFGSWNGNVVFGYPDLSVEQTLLQGDFPASVSSQINYQLDFHNHAGTHMQQTMLEWQYNPGQMILDSILSDYTYTADDDGLITFDLGKFAGRSDDSIQIQLTTNQDLTQGADIQTFAHIYGNGPEKNLDNNESVLHAAIGPHNNPVDSINPEHGGDGQSIIITNPPANEDSQDQQPDNQTPATTESKLTVTKTNNREGEDLEIGDIITFRIDVQNNGDNTIDNIILYDTLYTPEGEKVFTETFELDSLAKNKSLFIEYDLEITKDVPTGVYTNSAYAKGVTQNLQVVKSVTSTSSFKVANPEKLPEQPLEELPPEQQPPLEPSFPGPEIKPDDSGDVLGLRQTFAQARNRLQNNVRESFNRSKPRVNGQVAGEITNKHNQNPLLIPEASANEQGSESVFYNNIIVSSLFISILVGLGYSFATYRERLKIKKNLPKQ